MTREDIQALLPFLANETLDGEERDAAQAAVESDAELAAELAALRAVRATMHAEECVQGPGEFGLARLMRETGTVSQEPPQRRAPARLWQAVAAVLLAVVVGQTLFVMRGSEEPDGYRLAGEAALSVAFTEQATEAQMRELLLQAGVIIVDGPSALGFYQLKTVDGANIDTAAAILRNSAIIEALELP